MEAHMIKDNQRELTALEGNSLASCCVFFCNLFIRLQLEEIILLQEDLRQRRKKKDDERRMKEEHKDLLVIESKKSALLEYIHAVQRIKVTTFMHK